MVGDYRATTARAQCGEPAVKALDYGLWQVNRPGETLGPDQKTMIAVNVPTWITVGNILGFLLVLAVTFIVSRNIPGLLQMVILEPSLGRFK